LFNAPRRIAGSEGLTSLPPVESGVACGGRGVRQPMRLAERDNDQYRGTSPLNFAFPRMEMPLYTMTAMEFAFSCACGKTVIELADDSYLMN